MKTNELLLKAEDKFLTVVKESNSTLLWEKEKTFALQAIDGNSALQKCTPKSIIKAMCNISLTGLSLNPKKAYCYLIPRGGNAILDISYQGMIFMMTNQLNVKSIHADVVYEGDHFENEVTEDGVIFSHKADKFSKDRGEIIGVYAIAYLNGGGSSVAVLSEEEVNQIKATSQAAGTKFSPWSGSETIVNEMRKKTAIRRLWKIVPKNERIEEAVEGIRVFDESHDATFSRKREKQDLDNVFEEAEVVPNQEEQKTEK